MKRIAAGLVLSAVMSFGLISFAETMEHHHDMAGMSHNVMAKAVIVDAAGHKIGLASFLPLDKGVKISVQVSGLTPGSHGIHIHDTGKCDGPDFKTAGGHLNTAKHKHGLDNPDGHHNGDMQNIVIDKDGNGSVIIENSMISTGTDSLLKSGGTAIVIHEKTDDQKTDPAGNAGNRIGCGVIEAL